MKNPVEIEQFKNRLDDARSQLDTLQRRSARLLGQLVDVEIGQGHVETMIRQQSDLNAIESLQETLEEWIAKAEVKFQETITQQQ